MNYRKVKLIVLVNHLTVYNVTAVTKQNNNIELFPYLRNTINSMTEKTFNTSSDMYNWIEKLCSTNLMKPTLIGESFGAKLYDINFVSLTDNTITRLYFNR